MTDDGQVRRVWDERGGGEVDAEATRRGGAWIAR